MRNPVPFRRDWRLMNDRLDRHQRGAVYLRSYVLRVFLRFCRFAIPRPLGLENYEKTTMNFEAVFSICPNRCGRDTVL